MGLTEGGEGFEHLADLGGGRALEAAGEVGRAAGGGREGGAEGDEALGLAGGPARELGGVALLDGERGLAGRDLSLLGGGLVGGAEPADSSGRRATLRATMAGTSRFCGQP